MKLLQYTLVLILFLACKSASKQYVIEKFPALNLENAYYKNWTSGVRGGGAGYSIFIFMNNPKEVIVEGVFFKKGYSKLKFHGSNKYQGFIKNHQNLESDLIDDEPETEKKEEVLNEKNPFVLSKGEAIICYLEKDAKKYMKIELSRKESNEIPR